jgi:hypothetical protein
LLVGVLTFIAVCAAAGYVAYDKLMARVIPVYADDAEHFKYGSVGNTYRSASSLLPLNGRYGPKG